MFFVHANPGLSPGAKTLNPIGLKNLVQNLVQNLVPNLAYAKHPDKRKVFLNALIFSHTKA
jgi:hypothetical protein